MTPAPPSPAPDRPAPLVGARLALGLAALSGVLYFLGVPGMDVWPAAFVTKVPLLLALRGRSPRGAAWVGLAAGFSMSVLGFYWLFGMLRLFSGMPVPACALLMVATCAYQGGRMALTCWLTARAAARGWPAALAFVLASVAGELLYPLLFPWYFAFMMHRTPWLMQAADLGGVYLVGAVLLGPNLALAELLARPPRARAREPSGGRLGLLAPLLAAAYGAWRIRRVDALAAAAQEVTVGIAQGNLPLVTRSDGRAVHRRLTEELRARGAHLVVWSEGSVPDVLDEADAQPGATIDVTRGLGLPVLFGAGVRRPWKDDDTRELNTALLTDFDGKLIGRYDKQYLLPFGEFIPFGETSPRCTSGRPTPGA